ncbi:unnamed protein product [Cylicocyclus nassatus]|uniref:Uncharacterized protein n=1 Tax=Cylicocyclus nassatus TaxID=53992 RepID=A0AA36GGC0_CYLNA|nr:unnamed protein product [Cylicocyclus nassatus]
MMIRWLVLSGVPILASLLDNCYPGYNQSHYDPDRQLDLNCSNKTGKSLNFTFKSNFVRLLKDKLNLTLWPPYNCTLEVNATNSTIVQEKVTAEQGFWTPLTHVKKEPDAIASKLFDTYKSRSLYIPEMLTNALSFGCNFGTMSSGSFFSESYFACIVEDKPSLVC